MNEPQSLLQNLTTAPPGSALGTWQRVVRLIAISVPVLGAIPTAINLYQSWQHKIPYADVPYRLQQADLWVKNQDCPMNYKALMTGTGTRVEAGACPRTGDIGVRLAAPSGTIAYEWIPSERLKKPAGQASWWQIIAAAHAASDVQLAQAAPAGPPAAQPSAGVQAVCQSMQGASQMVRVMKDGAKCYRETFSVYRGQVEKREEVPCSTQCPPKR